MTLPILAIATDDDVLCPACAAKAAPGGSRYEVTVFETGDFYMQNGRVECDACGQMLFRCHRPGDRVQAMRVRG